MLRNDSTLIGIRLNRFGRRLVVMAAAGIVLLQSGCVRRTLTIRTMPEGATVRLNDEDIGQTPVTVDFTWYGDYDIAYELEGYQTIRTNKRFDPPWYQIPPIDLFAEAFIPFTLHDHREIEEELEPQTLPARAELIPRAREFRDRTLYSED